MPTLNILKPDDAHLHLRDGEYLPCTVLHTAERFARAVVMPNLKPPLVNLADVLAYKTRIMAAVPTGMTFEPLMTLYLTETLDSKVIQMGKSSELIHAVKLYPAGVTTHSEAGIKKLDRIYPVLDTMERIDLPLLIHGESNDPAVDIFDREKYFLDELERLRQRFPKLRIVLEHITTEEATQFVLQQNSKNLAATITPHHLLLNRNDLLGAGIRPHYYCLPILKRRRHQEALLAAAISGHPAFFLGTDSAPHAISAKESACGCAGIYSAHAGIELYAEIFENAGALEKLEAFSSHYAAEFYKLPRNTSRITLVKQPWQVSETYVFGKEKLQPFKAGEILQWRLM